MSNEIVIYTDGACSGNPGPGGWGTVILIDGKEVKLSGGEKETTNNRMEMMASIQGFLYLEHNGYKGEPITVYTDSQYLQKGITEWIGGWIKRGWKTASKGEVKNVDLWKVLHHYNAEFNILEWKWVKGHAGNKYNEMCDKLATDYVKNF